MDSKELVQNNYEMAATATAAQAKAEIECAFIMAIRRPRNIEDVRTKILGACRRPIFAESAEWSKPVGGKTLSGPSIRFVETALQAYGNVRTATTVVYEDEKIRKVHVSVTDLENNNAFGLDVTLQKTVERKTLKKGQRPISERVNSYGEKVFIVEATEDDMANKQGAMVSKLIRQNGLRLIPQDIIEEAMETAKKTREGNCGDPEAAKRKILDAFSELGIKPSSIEQYLGKKIEQVLPKEIAELRKIYTAIKEGEAKWSDYVQDAEPAESMVEKLKKMKAEKPAELTDAQKEIASLPEGVIKRIGARGKLPADFRTWTDEQCSKALDIKFAIEEENRLEAERGF